ATWPERLRTVVLPGVRPHIGTSFRVALGIGWVVLVPAEMFGVTNGLGYAVLNARDDMDYSALAATMLLIGVLGYLPAVSAQQIPRQHWRGCGAAPPLAPRSPLRSSPLPAPRSPPLARPSSRFWGEYACPAMRTHPKTSNSPGSGTSNSPGSETSNSPGAQRP